MDNVMYAVCVTIVVCYLIRYSCIYLCQQQEYNLYREKTKKSSPLVLRPYYYSDEVKKYWGYVIFDTEKNNVFTGIEGKTTYTIFRNKDEAQQFLCEINELYEYDS